MTMTAKMMMFMTMIFFLFISIEIDLLVWAMYCQSFSLSLSCNERCRKLFSFTINVFRIFSEYFLSQKCTLWCEDSYFWKLLKKFFINGLFDWNLLIWSLTLHKTFDAEGYIIYVSRTQVFVGNCSIDFILVVSLQLIFLNTHTHTHTHTGVRWNSSWLFLFSLYSWIIERTPFKHWPEKTLMICSSIFCHTGLIKNSTTAKLMQKIFFKKRIFLHFNSFV